jgi:glycosyltransferase involved in cell wall biosynthesis
MYCFRMVVLLALYYRGADAYVCSSRYEADSTTAVEALACGTPVVGTDVPGIEKTLSFNNGGLGRSGREVDRRI